MHTGSFFQLGFQIFGKVINPCRLRAEFLRNAFSLGTWVDAMRVYEADLSPNVTVICLLFIADQLEEDLDIGRESSIFPWCTNVNKVEHRMDALVFAVIRRETVLHHSEHLNIGKCSVAEPRGINTFDLMFAKLAGTCLDLRSTRIDVI